MTQVIVIRQYSYHVRTNAIECESMHADTVEPLYTQDRDSSFVLCTRTLCT